ncbi:hypothetical protein D9M70_652540 [compost metagenome]
MPVRANLCRDIQGKNIDMVQDDLFTVIAENHPTARFGRRVILTVQDVLSAGSIQRVGKHRASVFRGIEQSLS